jgi:Carboxypeptidase regulatory-like domain
MTTVLRFAGALVFVLSAAGVAAKQQPGQEPAASPPSGLILGRTVDLTSGQGIGGAVVSLNGGPPPVAAGQALPATLSRFPLRVISDSAGHFVFHDLPKGAYTITATNPGYADTAYGRRTPADTGGQSLVLAEGERRGDVTLVFWKSATIAGTVVDEANEPVIGLEVRVFKRAMVGGKVRFTQFGNMPTTDDRGMYRTTALAPGDYVVGVVTTQATVPTSLQAAFAAAQKSGTAADLQRDLNRSNSPFQGLGVFSAGQRFGSWLLATPAPFGNQGQLTGPPVSGARVFVYPTVFYPSATAPTRATIVTVGSDEERSGIDVQVKPVVTSRVSGTLAGPNGPEPFASLDLMSAGADDLQRETDFATASTITDETGAFVFLGVPTGSYTIRGLKIPPRPVTTSNVTTVIQTGSGTIMSVGAAVPPPISDEPTFWALVPISVGEADVAGVDVVFRAGARLGGRLEFDGAAPKPAADRLPTLAVQVESADGRTTSSNQFTLARGVVDATGQFKTYQLPPGRYLVRGFGPLPEWTFKGASLGGRDITDAPLDLGGEDIGDIVVTFTDKPTELSGAVRDSQGPDGSATVLVFPAQAGQWVDYGQTPRRLRSARAGSDGSYHIPNLPPGDYFVTAIHSSVPADWQDVKYLQKLSAIATRVTIADGEKKSQDVLSKEVR